MYKYIRRRSEKIAQLEHTIEYCDCPMFSHCDTCTPGTHVYEKNKRLRKKVADIESEYPARIYAPLPTEVQAFQMTVANMTNDSKWPLWVLLLWIDKRIVIDPDVVIGLLLDCRGNKIFHPIRLDDWIVIHECNDMRGYKNSAFKKLFAEIIAPD